MRTGNPFSFLCLSSFFFLHAYGAPHVERAVGRVPEHIASAEMDGTDQISPNNPGYLHQLAVQASRDGERERLLRERAQRAAREKGKDLQILHDAAAENPGTLIDGILPDEPEFIEMLKEKDGDPAVEDAQYQEEETVDQQDQEEGDLEEGEELEELCMFAGRYALKYALHPTTSALI